MSLTKEELLELLDIINAKMEYFMIHRGELSQKEAESWVLASKIQKKIITALSKY